MGTLLESESLGDRIAVLVELYHGGSVNAAAKDLAVAQQTLARAIEDRKRTGPRGSVVARLVTFYRCDAAWLLTGEGAAPRPVDGDEAKLELAKLRWVDMVRRLDAEPKVSDGLLKLPVRVSNVRKVFRELSASPSSEELGPSVLKAARLEIEMWSALLEAALAAPKGADHTRLLVAFAEDQVDAGGNPGNKSGVDLIFRGLDGETWDVEVKASKQGNVTRARKSRQSS